ncbi:Hsp20/alpha crystallin family protein [Lujinxingia vulgaris]|uniref:Hsp20/alpha crystallin family protein n=1 Tax=Lujinxingia vulgaris TaxID=2600176 RepID=A0A5C6XGL4_9DELT|nr:Hsp20/alpha crystallin family protein [Lujinxingia vulgaris]TXD42812.1 Hsp20/alpha crystallin family protein [Lujinxingia vulgaris]
MSTSPWFDDPYQLFRQELRSMMGEPSVFPYQRRDRQAASRRTMGVFPPVNIYDNGDAFMIRAEMPGIDRDSLDVSSKADQVVIRGERNLERMDDADVHRRERDAGQFRRAITLPQPIDVSKVEATYTHGILEIIAPRKEDARPRRITIK